MTFIKKLNNIKLVLILAIANIGVFLFLWMQSGYSSPDNGRLLDWGANFAPLTLTGESWRLLSSAFLHANWLHLALNMYMLLILGSLLERMVGSLRFGVIYLLSAIGGSLLSAFWHGYHEVSGMQQALGELIPVTAIRPVVSVGASGALMGLAGAAIALAIWHRDGWPRDSSIRISGRAIAQVIAINLVSGFFTAGVDQAAHCGGLIVGFLAALVLCQGDPRKSIFQRAGLPLLVGALGSAALFAIAQHGQSSALLDWKSQILAERAKEQAQQNAIKETQAAEQMIREDKRTRPAPVAASIAAGTVIRVSRNPDHMAIGSSGKYVYVTDNAANTLSVVDVAKRAVIRTIQGDSFKASHCLDSYCRGVGAAGIAVSADERYAYVASMREDSLVRIDLSTGMLLDAVKLGSFPREVLLSPAGDRLFVANGQEDSVSVVSVTHWPQVMATLKLSDQSVPQGVFRRPVMMWLSADSRRFFVNTVSKSSMLEFDTQTFRLVGEHALNDFSAAMPISSTGGVWLSGGQDALAWADPDTLAVRKTYPVCTSSAQMIAGANDGKLVAVANSYSKTPAVSVIKVATRLSMGSYPVVNGASQAIFGQDNKTLYVIGSGQDSGTLSILDLDKYVAGDDGERGDFLCPASAEGESQGS